MMNPIEERCYAIAVEEVASKRVVPSLFAKAFSDADGDEKKTIARYIKLRVQQLEQQFESELAEREAQAKEEERANQRKKSACTAHKKEDISCAKCHKKLDPEKTLYWCPRCRTTVGICCIGWWNKCGTCGTKLEYR